MTRLSSAILIFISCSAMAQNPAHPVDDCETVEKCIQRAYEVAEPDKTYIHITNNERPLVTRLVQFGSEAVPELVKLLADPNEDVAGIAAAALRDVSHIDKKFLPEIVRGLDRDLPWLPPALGRINSSNAAREAVERLLVSDSAPHNQEAYAVRLSGRRAIPFIAEAASCRKPCGEEDHYLLGYVLGEMGPERADAAEPLFEIVTSELSPETAVYGALYMISRLGEYGLPLEERLLKLRDKRPDLLNAIDSALVGIVSTFSGEVFTKRLREWPDILILRDVAERGTQAKSAGPAVIELLSNADWDIRLGAARALGFIEDEPAVSHLIPLLRTVDDVRLNWVAAESLGRIRSPLAIDALTNTADTHWYPPVRTAAEEALNHIQNRSEYTSQYHPNNFPFEFFAYQWMGGSISECDSVEIDRIPEPADTKLYRSDAFEKLEKLSYESTIVGYGPKDVPLPVEDGEVQVVEVTPKDMIENRETIDQVPGVALKIEGGWLAGSDRGEWGGELVHISDNGQTRTVLDENVEDIYQLGDNYVAVTGLSHMLTNQGILFQLTTEADGTWHAHRWRQLPGSPISSWLVETGELLIETSGGGSILISPNGSMRMVPCRAEN